MIKMNDSPFSSHTVEQSPTAAPVATIEASFESHLTTNALVSPEPAQERAVIVEALPTQPAATVSPELHPQLPPTTPAQLEPQSLTVRVVQPERARREMSREAMLRVAGAELGITSSSNTPRTADEETEVAPLDDVPLDEVQQSRDEADLRHVEAPEVTPQPEATTEASEPQESTPEAQASELEPEDEFLWAEDLNGNRISPEEVGAAVKRVYPLKFPVGNIRHVVEVRLGNVPYWLTKQLKGLTMLLAFQAGYKDGETIDPFAKDDERFNALVTLCSESAEIRQVHAEIAAAAPIRDDKGRVRTSVADFREDLTAQKLLEGGITGEAFIDTVVTWYQNNSD